MYEVLLPFIQTYIYNDGSYHVTGWELHLLLRGRIFQARCVPRWVWPSSVGSRMELEGRPVRPASCKGRVQGGMDGACCGLCLSYKTDAEIRPKNHH